MRGAPWETWVKSATPNGCNKPTPVVIRPRGVEDAAPYGRQRNVSISIAVNGCAIAANFLPPIGSPERGAVAALCAVTEGLVQRGVREHQRYPSTHAGRVGERFQSVTGAIRLPAQGRFRGRRAPSRLFFSRQGGGGGYGGQGRDGDEAEAADEGVQYLGGDVFEVEDCLPRGVPWAMKTMSSAI